MIMKILRNKQLLCTHIREYGACLLAKAKQNMPYFLTSLKPLNDTYIQTGRSISTFIYWTLQKFTVSCLTI